MGIRGLLGHCLRNERECVQNLDLVKVAKERKGIELLVDFGTFKRFMLLKTTTAISKSTGNSMIPLLGGEYKQYGDALVKIYTDLKAFGIELVIIIDGSKGSCPDLSIEKMDRWVETHGQDVDKLNELNDIIENASQDGCTTDESIFTNDKQQVPILHMDQILMSLSTAGCEVVTCPTGEADDVVAYQFQQRPKAFAILSNDSDFCVFRGSAFIPDSLFDIKEDLHLGEADMLQWKPPKRLIVGLIMRERVAASLKLESPDQMIDLSIVSGNDYTNKVIKERLRGARVTGVYNAAKVVRYHGRLENHPEIRHLLATDPVFAQRVAHSKKFYSMTAVKPIERRMNDDPCLKFLYDKVSAGEYPDAFIAMYIGVYWHVMITEETTENNEGCEIMLRELRRHLYTILLDKELTHVLEYERVTRELVSRKVTRSSMTDLPSVMSIDEMTIQERMDIFSRILTHYEPDLHPTYFEDHGTKLGFIMYLLRYLLNIAKKFNLHVQKYEMMAIAAAMLAEADVDYYQRLCVKPTMRAVSLNILCQNIYIHAKRFLGGILGLSNDFPQVGDLFSGAVWGTFYMVSANSADITRIGLSHEDGNQVLTEMKQAVVENCDMLNEAMAGFISF